MAENICNSTQNFWILLSCSLGWIWLTHNTLLQSSIFLFSSSLIHQFSIRLELWRKHWIWLATSCGWRKRVDFERKWENPDLEAAQTGKERKSGFRSGKRVNYSNLCHRRPKTRISGDCNQSFCRSIQNMWEHNQQAIRAICRGWIWRFSPMRERRNEVSATLPPPPLTLHV